MKKISVCILSFIVAVAALMLPAFFMSVNTPENNIANANAQRSGLTNINTNYTTSPFVEDKTGSISFLKIIIPAASSDIKLNYVIAGIKSEDISVDEKGTVLVPDSVLFFTNSARYELTFTLNNNNYSSSCYFSPTILLNNINWLTPYQNEYYALNPGVQSLAYNTDLFLVDEVTIESNVYKANQLVFKSKASNEWFTLNYFTLTTQFLLKFYDRSDNTLSSVYQRETGSNFNVFNSEVKVVVELSNNSITNKEKEQIFNLFNFSSSNGTNGIDYEKLSANSFIFNETGNRLFTIKKQFKGQTIQSDIDSLKIITVLPNSSSIKITFKEAVESFDYIKDFFKPTPSADAVINSTNSTINVSGPRELVYSVNNSSIENIFKTPEKVYYSYNSNSLGSLNYNNVYAFAFKSNYTSSKLSTVFSSNRTPENNTAFYGSYNSYQFTINTTNFNPNLRMRITLNGIKYDYEFEKNTLSSFNLTLPGDYIIEIYAFNNYDILKSAWSSATGNSTDSFNIYSRVNTYNLNENNIALKRSFQIKGAYTTATTETGNYLFNNQLTNAQKVIVKVNGQESVNDKYEIFFNNKFYSSNVENITSTGATFSTPGLWTIQLYKNGLLLPNSTFSFTILSKNYQNFSFYSNPTTYENIKVRVDNKEIEHPENNTYHLQDKGRYVVTSVYKSIFNLTNTSGKTVVLNSDTNATFDFEIKNSSFEINLETGKNGDRVTNNIVINSTLSEVTATKMEVYLNGTLIRTYNSNQTKYIDQMSSDDRTFTENGIYTIVIFDEYNNSYQLQVEKYYKMNAATAILIAAVIITVLVVVFLILKLRKGVKVK